MRDIAECHGVVIVPDKAGVLDRPTAQIAREVGDHATAVLITFLDADVPLLASRLLEQRQRPCRIETWRQEKLAAANQALDQAQQLAAEDHSHDRQRQQKTLADGLPGTLLSQTSAGDQTVQMRMQHKRAAPGVQGDDHSGTAAKMTRIFQKQEQSIAHGLEERVGQLLEVPRPQWPQLGRQREDYMEVITRQDLSLLRVEPTLDLEMGALGAGAMATGVVPNLLDVALRASSGVASQRGGATAQKGPRCCPLEKRQRVGLQILRKARFEYRLQGGDGESTSRSIVEPGRENKRLQELIILRSRNLLNLDSTGAFAPSLAALSTPA